MGTTPNSLITQSQSLIMPPNGPMTVGIAPSGSSNVALPPGGAMKVNMPPSASQGVPLPPGPAPTIGIPSGPGPLPNMPPQGSQHRLMPGHPLNPAMPPQGLGAQQGVQQGVPPNVEAQNSQANIIAQGGPQNSHQQFHQVPPGGEQSHSGSTGELISFD